MDKLVYLLFGPLGCIVGMAACMAMMGRGKRRPEPEAGSIEEIAVLRAEVAELRREQAEPTNG